MALTVAVTNLNFKYADGRKLRLIQCTGDNAYPTGGYPITPASVNLTAITDVVADGAMGAEGNGGTALVPSWDKTNGKLKLWKGNGTSALQEAGSTDPNGLKCQALVVGY